MEFVVTNESVGKCIRDSMKFQKHKDAEQDLSLSLLFFPQKWYDRRMESERSRHGMGNIYNQIEVCTQCMHSNMYLMHNKKIGTTERMRGRECDTRKNGNNDDKNEYTKKCEKHGVSMQ